MQIFTKYLAVAPPNSLACARDVAGLALSLSYNESEQ